MGGTHSIEIFYQPKRVAEFIQLNFTIISNNETRTKKVKKILKQLSI